MRLDGKISVSVEVISGVPQSSVLEPLLFVLYTSELFRVVEKHMVCYADVTTIYAVISRLLLCPLVIKSLIHNLVAVHSRCFKWHMRLNPKKTRSMVLAGLGPMLSAIVILLLVIPEL